MQQPIKHKIKQSSIKNNLENGGSPEKKYVVVKGNKRLSSVYTNALPTRDKFVGYNEPGADKFGMIDEAAPGKMFVFRENSWIVFPSIEEFEERVKGWKDSIRNDDRFDDKIKKALISHVDNFNLVEISEDGGKMTGLTDDEKIEMWYDTVDEKELDEILRGLGWKPYKFKMVDLDNLSAPVYPRWNELGDNYWEGFGDQLKQQLTEYLLKKYPDLKTASTPSEVFEILGETFEQTIDDIIPGNIELEYGGTIETKYISVAPEGTVFVKINSHRASHYVRRTGIPNISFWNMYVNKSAAQSVHLINESDYDKIKDITGVSVPLKQLKSPGQVWHPRPPMEREQKQKYDPNTDYNENRKLFDAYLKLNEKNYADGGEIKIEYVGEYETLEEAKSNSKHLEEDGDTVCICNKKLKNGGKIEKFISKYNLHGKDNRVRFVNDPQRYFTKNIHPDRKHIFVYEENKSGNRAIKNKRIVDIVSVNEKPASVYLMEDGGEISDDELNELTELTKYKKSLRGQAVLDFINGKTDKGKRYEELLEKYGHSESFSKDLGIMENGGKSHTVKKYLVGGEIGTPQWTEQVINDANAYFDVIKTEPVGEDYVRYIQDTLKQTCVSNLKTAQEYYRKWLLAKEESMKNGGIINRYKPKKVNNKWYIEDADPIKKLLPDDMRIESTLSGNFIDTDLKRPPYVDKQDAQKTSDIINKRYTEKLIKFLKMEDGGEISPQKKVKANQAIAISEVVSNSKSPDGSRLFKDLGPMEAGMLYNLRDKEGTKEVSDATGLKEQVYKKLEDKFYIDVDYNDYTFTLTDKAKDFIERVNNRLETRKLVKAGLDLFPETANIPELAMKNGGLAGEKVGDFIFVEKSSGYWTVFKNNGQKVALITKESYSHPNVLPYLATIKNEYFLVTSLAGKQEKFETIEDVKKAFLEFKMEDGGKLNKEYEQKYHVRMGWYGKKDKDMVENVKDIIRWLNERGVDARLGYSHFVDHKAIEIPVGQSTKYEKAMANIRKTYGKNILADGGEISDIIPRQVPSYVQVEKKFTKTDFDKLISELKLDSIPNPKNDKAIIIGKHKEYDYIKAFLAYAVWDSIGHRLFLAGSLSHKLPVVKYLADKNFLTEKQLLKLRQFSITYSIDVPKIKGKLETIGIKEGVDYTISDKEGETTGNIFTFNDLDTYSKAYTRVFHDKNYADGGEIYDWENMPKINVNEPVNEEDKHKINAGIYNYAKFGKQELTFKELADKMVHSRSRFADPKRTLEIQKTLMKYPKNIITLPPDWGKFGQELSSTYSNGGKTNNLIPIKSVTIIDSEGKNSYTRHFPKDFHDFLSASEFIKENFEITPGMGYYKHNVKAEWADGEDWTERIDIGDRENNPNEYDNIFGAYILDTTLFYIAIAEKDGYLSYMDQKEVDERAKGYADFIKKYDFQITKSDWQKVINKKATDFSSKWAVNFKITPYKDVHEFDDVIVKWLGEDFVNKIGGNKMKLGGEVPEYKYITLYDKTIHYE